MALFTLGPGYGRDAEGAEERLRGEGVRFDGVSGMFVRVRDQGGGHRVEEMGNEDRWEVRRFFWGEGGV